MEIGPVTAALLGLPFNSRFFPSIDDNFAGAPTISFHRRFLRHRRFLHRYFSLVDSPDDIFPSVDSFADDVLPTTLLLLLSPGMLRDQGVYTLYPNINSSTHSTSFTTAITRPIVIPCVPLQPSGALAEGTNFPSAILTSTQPRAVLAFTQHPETSSLSSPFCFNPTPNCAIDTSLAVACMTKRHRDALTIKLYHLYANILSTTWFYDGCSV